MSNWEKKVSLSTKFASKTDFHQNWYVVALYNVKPISIQPYTIQDF